MCFISLTVFFCFSVALALPPLDFLALTLALAACEGAPRGKMGICVRLWPQGSPFVFLALCALVDLHILFHGQVLCPKADAELLCQPTNPEWAETLCDCPPRCAHKASTLGSLLGLHGSCDLGRS